MKKSYAAGLILVLLIILISIFVTFSQPKINGSNQNANNSGTVTPGKSLLNMASFIWPEMVEMKAGESEEINITLETRKNGPGEVVYNIFQVSNKYSKEEIPLPDGLTIIVEPAVFLAQPDTTYESSIKIQAESELPQGEYVLFIDISFKGVQEGGGWFTVKVI